jgi:hypothetical protein
MAIILNTWSVMVSTKLNPQRTDLASLSDDSIQLLVAESEDEQEKVRVLLIEGIVDRPKIRDKQQFVQVNQAMIIRLLDKLHYYKNLEGQSEKSIKLFNVVSQHLERTLDFIEDFFSNYFDRNEKVPASYLAISIEELRRQLAIVSESLESSRIEVELASIVIRNFRKFCSEESISVTYNQLVYQKDLINELLTDQTLESESNIEKVLFYFNFNDDDYVTYLYEKLKMLTKSLNHKKEKIAALRLEQKNINQMRNKLNCYLSAKTPSLKEQINQWIEEEVKFLETEQASEKSLKADDEVEDKIQTSLSVAKLALLLRLMVTDKIIINRVVAQVLRTATKTVTTLQKETISFGSLETKYHNPERGTISAVKEMLFRWINILNKL